MDAKEALRYFNFVVTLGRAYYPNSEEFKAHELAVEAFEKVETLEAENARLKEKETPVKIRTETEGIYEPYDDVPVGRKVNLYCGKCGKPLTAYHDYCYWCGQAIKNDKE